MFICRNCKMTRDDEPEKCWNCGADRRGQVHEKQVDQTWKLLRELDNEKFKCPHGIMRFRPCEKCGRSGEALGSHRTSAQAHIQDVLVKSGLVKTKAQAAIAAKALIDKADV